MDGETKIRWSGATNSSATYKIYLPLGVMTQRTGRINILDMRYGDDRIQVDISEKNAALITQIERPMSVELVSNGTDAIKYNLKLSDNCTITQIDGDLVKNEEDGSYEIVNATGKFVINYSYSIFGETIQSKYVSDNQEKLKISTSENGVFTFALLDGSIFLKNNAFDVNMYIQGMSLKGTGLEFKKIKDITDNDLKERFSTLMNWSFCTFNSDDNNPLNTKFEISINDKEYHPLYILLSEYSEWMEYSMIFKAPEGVNYSVDVYSFKIKLNGYVIFTSDMVPGGINKIH